MDHATPSRLLRLRAAGSCLFSGGACAKSCPRSLAAPQASVTDRLRARERDQFYTCPTVAKHLLRSLSGYASFGDHLFIDPSAGTGSFFLKLPAGSIGYDIEPKCPGVIEADFLSVAFPRNQPIFVVGNPPFGRNSALAIAFFNHAAFFADFIAFIVPKSFRKISIQNRLDLNFHLVAEIPVPDNAFIFDGKSKHVPTVFQIWRRQDTARHKVKLPLSHPDFEILRNRHGANAVIQRVGARAGSVHYEFSRSENSHYFIQAKSPEVLEKLSSVDFSETASNSAGCPSLSKGELFFAYSRTQK